jgi:GWxTD domain-containing protein
MGRFSTDSLQAGSYAIHLELLDQQYKPLISQDRFIEMRRFMSETELLKMVDLSLTFVSKYTEEAVLMEHIKSLLPIAQNAEKNAIDYQAPTYNLKQKQGFLYYFWQKRNPSNPQLAWENYQKELAAVDKEFGSRIKKGWETDRGRVYLQYGRPSTRVVRNNNPDYWPFEIWHYYETNNHLHDRRLLFYNTALDGDFELLHSDIPGERTNFDWKNLVRSRQMNSPGVISRLKNNQARDPYSMDELEDLWYNPH